MNMSKLFLFVSISFFVFGLKSITLAQGEPVLYFCQAYTSSGEVGISDRFTTGYLTIMIKCDTALGLNDCHIQYDKWNPKTNEFEFYKKFDFTIQPDKSYIYFSKNDNSDLSFDEPGFYRVYLQDENDNTIASSLVQIVSK